VRGTGEGDPEVEEATVTVRAGRNGSGVLLEVVRRLDAVNLSVYGLGVRRPSLDDVFLALTGHKAETDEPKEAAE
jgi:ABC-2 type transport system ATP-binding protein